MKQIQPDFFAMKTTKDKIKIFLVDDDIMFTKSLRHTLNKEEAEIKTFPTGEDCLKALLKENPEVVVLDYYFNNNRSKAMNGIQILNKIMKNAPGTKVIMLSSQKSRGIAEDMIKYGAYDYVPKGRHAFMKVENDIDHIYGDKEQYDSFNKETNRLKRTDILVMVTVIILYVISRFI